MPAQQRRGGAAEERRPESAGRADSRTAQRARRSAPPERKGGAKAVLFALGLPVLGAVIDEVIGGGIGYAFAVCMVLGTLLAALVSSRAGLWWVATAPPPVVLALTAGAELLAHGDKYQGKNLATGAAKWAIHGFPVMAAAVLAALLAGLFKKMRGGGKPQEGRSRRG